MLISLIDEVPNTGSWTWQVPLDFKTGRYVLSGFTGDYWDLHNSGSYLIVVGNEEPAECEQSASPSRSPSPAATSQAGNATNTSA